MKQAFIASIAAAAVMATESGSYQFREEALPTFRAVAEPTRVPFAGRSSNDPRDPDIKRLDSRRADPRASGEPSPQAPIEFRTGDELILKSERNKRTPDPVLALRPRTRELFPGSGIYEPVEENYQKKQAPIFLVDPKFTKEMKEEEKVFFEDNDFGGFNEPAIHVVWPLVGNEVQNFFGVDKACRCTREGIFITWPEFKQLNLPQGIEEVWEPQYKDYTYEVPKMNQHTMYRGDDFGGHNIPFPHPVPPKPVGAYEDAFIDLARVFDVPRVFESPNADILFRYGGYGKSQAETYSSQWIYTPSSYNGSSFGQEIQRGEIVQGQRGDAYRGESLGYNNQNVDTRFGGPRRQVDDRGDQADDVSYVSKNDVHQNSFNFRADQERNSGADRDEGVARGRANRSFDQEGDRSYVFENQREYDNEPAYNFGQYGRFQNRAW